MLIASTLTQRDQSNRFQGSHYPPSVRMNRGSVVNRQSHAFTPLLSVISTCGSTLSDTGNSPEISIPLGLIVNSREDSDLCDALGYESIQVQVIPLQ
jgi:hypothetical protein